MSAGLSLRPLGNVLGTEVVGADLSRPLDGATFERKGASIDSG